MKYFVYIIVALLLMILQTTVLHNFSQIKIIPDLMFVFVLGLCFIKNFNEAAIVAVVGGLFTDLFSAKSFGLTAIALMAIVLVTYFLTQSLVDTEKVPSKVWVTILSSIVYFTIILGASFVFDIMDLSANELTFSTGLLYSFIGGIALNVIFILPIHPMLKFVDSIIVRGEKRREIRI